MKRKKMTLIKKKALQGYLYLIPWLVGVIFFFAFPVIQTTIYSFQEVEKATLTFSFVGFANYKYAFMGDAKFPQLLIESITSTLSSVPTILIFSFFVALLLKKKFKGDFMLKAIFFLTVILSSDVFLRMQADTGSLVDAQMGGVVADGGSFFQAMETFDLNKYFDGLEIGTGFLTIVTDAIKGLSTIIIKSGIQIFIFLAALYSVPASMYEAAQVEGASGWESFWKITLPMVSPMLLVNLVYSIVDSFSSYLNPTLNYIYDQGIKNFNIGYASALSWIFFAIIAVILGAVFYFVNRKVFYQR